MARLDERWKALRRQLERLGRETRDARGEMRTRLKRADSQARAALERALREAEPRVKRALDDAARIGRGLRAGVKAGAAAYRASIRRRT
jgi:hypothetical protein